MLACRAEHIECNYICIRTTSSLPAGGQLLRIKAYLGCRITGCRDKSLAEVSPDKKLVGRRFEAEVQLETLRC